MSLINIIGKFVHSKSSNVSYFFTGSYNSFFNNLSWNLPAPVNNFELQRGLSSSYTDAIDIYTGSIPNYIDTAKLNQNYYYRVRGISGGISGSWFNLNLNTLPPDGTTGTGSYFFGDSITAGVGASIQAKRWSSVLSTSESWAENNHGVNGSTVTPNACLGSLQLFTIPTKTTALNYLFISFGTNDCFLNPGPFATGSVTVDQYSSSLETAISYSLNLGWPANRIIVSSLFYTTFNGLGIGNCSCSIMTDEVRRRQFLSAAQSASLQYGTNFINQYDNMSSSGGPSLLISDMIHPNDTGHAVIANYTYTLINH